MKIGIIGAGVTGIHLAYHLGKAGHEVTLYEKAPFIGGLAHYYPIDGTYLEKFYHFIMTADVEYLDFLEELGVGDQLNWVETRTSFFANGRMYPFTGPVDILKFGDIPLLSRIRFAATMAYLTLFASDWKKLEKHLAHDWLKRWCGRKAWDSIWVSNLRMKFGTHVEELAMPWIWARSRMVRQYRDKDGPSNKEKRAWVKGSTKTFLEAAQRGLDKHGVKTRLGVDVTINRADENGSGGRVVGVTVAGEEMTPHERVVFCAPNYVLDAMLPNATGPYFDLIRDQKYFGVVCVVIALDRNLTPDFWTYVNDPRVPFVGVINYSPFCNYPGHEGHHVIYLPAYGDADGHPFTTPDEELLSSYVAGLKVMWPEFDASWIREKRVFRVPNASMRVMGEYSKKLVPIKSPVEGFYFANLSQIYPQDRGISIGMKLAQYAYTAVSEDRDVEMNFVPY